MKYYDNISKIQKLDNISTSFFCATILDPMKFIGEKSAVGVLKILSIFMLTAVALGFFSSIGIWAAVSFLRLFGIETL